MGVGNIFSRGAIVDFSRGSQNDFCRGGQKWWNFFSSRNKEDNPIFGKNLIRKCQISKSRGLSLDAHPWTSLPLLPTPMEGKIGQKVSKDWLFYFMSQTWNSLKTCPRLTLVAERSLPKEHMQNIILDTVRDDKCTGKEKIESFVILALHSLWSSGS